jgi:hypothetical protein
MAKDHNVLPLWLAESHALPGAGCEKTKLSNCCMADRLCVYSSLFNSWLLAVWHSQKYVDPGQSEMLRQR